MKQTEFNEVQKASHYNQNPSGVECIEVIEHYPCNIANAIKYLWRCDHKHESPMKDLYKALYYVAREINLQRKKRKLDADEIKYNPVV